jgi:hypothetical protein
MQVSFEKVARNGCARYVPLYALLCAKRAIVITAFDYRDAEVSISNTIEFPDDTDTWCDFTVIHAEMPVQEPGKPEPRGLQLWVDLPKQYKMVEPSYQELEPEK